MTMTETKLSDEEIQGLIELNVFERERSIQRGPVLMKTTSVKTSRAPERALWWLIDQGSLWILCRSKTMRQIRNVAAQHWGEYADIPEELVENDNE